MKYLFLALILFGCTPYRYVIQKADIIVSKHRAYVIKTGAPVPIPDTIIQTYLIYKKPINRW